MTRTALLLTSLFAAACTVGEIPSSGVNPGPSPSPDASTDGVPAGNGCVNRVTPPASAHNHGGGVTYAGANCMQAGACHLDAGSPAPQFQFSGTMYKADGTTPSVGVNIRVKPAAGGAETSLVSDDAGNFSLLLSATTPVALPAKTDVTACPTLTPMVTQLLAGPTGGACNLCHSRTGGTTAVITIAD
jgi:hypothetical protein